MVMKNKKGKVILLIAGLLLLCAAVVVVCILLSSRASENEPDLTPIDACILKIYENGSLLVYINPGPDKNWGGVWGVRTEGVKFISHDETIESAEDLQPGQMIRFVSRDTEIDAIWPSSFREIDYIETWGEFDNSLYEEGLCAYEEGIGPY